MISSADESALKNALNDPDFPSSNVVAITEKQKSTLRRVLEVGLSCGQLPLIPNLGALMSIAGTGNKNDRDHLKSSGVITTTKKNGKDWIIPPAHWHAIIEAAHNSGNGSSQKGAVESFSVPQNPLYHKVEKIAKALPGVNKQQIQAVVSAIIVELEKEITERKALIIRLEDFI